MISSRAFSEALAETEALLLRITVARQDICLNAIRRALADLEGQS